MSRRLWFIPLAVFAATVLYLSYWRFTANDVEILLQKDTPFAVRLALINEKKEASLTFLGQLIVFPKHKHIVLYCVNTDAHYRKELIREMSPREADFFGNYSEIFSSNYIHITHSSGARLFDLLGGVTFFSEENLLLKKAVYQYPHGMHYYPGEHIFEYISNRRYKKNLSPENQYAGRLFRQESMLLNLFWNRKELASGINKSGLGPLAAGMISSGFSLAELSSLVDYILGENIHLNVLEIPLGLRRKKGRHFLYVKEKRAGQLFRNQLSRQKIRWLKSSDDYALQILNGTNTQGLARRIKSSLQNLDVHITDVDNYEPKPLFRTMIIERSGDTLTAKHLMDLMGMSPRRVSFYRKASDLDISLLVGRDFSLKKLQPK